MKHRRTADTGGPHPQALAPAVRSPHAPSRPRTQLPPPADSPPPSGRSDQVDHAREGAIDLAPALAHIAEALETSLDRMVAGAVAAIWEQVPAYQDSRDERLRRDVAAHVEAVGRAFLISLTDRRPARRADFGPTPAQAQRRVEQGISLADFLQAFRIGQFTLWQGVLEAGRCLLFRAAACRGVTFKSTVKRSRD